MSLHTPTEYRLLASSTDLCLKRLWTMGWWGWGDMVVFATAGLRAEVPWPEDRSRRQDGAGADSSRKLLRSALEGAADRDMLRGWTESGWSRMSEDGEGDGLVTAHPVMVPPRKESFGFGLLLMLHGIPVLQPRGRVEMGAGPIRAEYCFCLQLGQVGWGTSGRHDQEQYLRMHLKPTRPPPRSSVL